MADRSPFEREDVVSHYEDWYGTPYGALADRIERAILSDLLRPVEPGGSLLEIGCGTGHFALALSRAGYASVGVDPSLPMLAIARARIPAVCGAGESLPFRDGAFDAALLVFVLEFASDPVAVVREARRVARRRVVVLTVGAGSWLALRRRVAGWRGHPIFSRARFLSRARLVEAIRSSGAEPEGVRTALYLPPLVAARAPGLEMRLAKTALPCAGVVAVGFGGAGSKGVAPRDS